MELSPIDIYKEIKNTPLYQQDDLFKHYEGIDIKGIGSLCSIDLDSFVSYIFNEDKLENGIYVHMLTYNNEIDVSWQPTIWCYADLNKYPELKFKKNREKISFIGKIKKVQAEDIYVINPVFTFESEETSSNKNKIFNSKVQLDDTNKKEIHIEKLEIISGDKVGGDKIEQYGNKNKASTLNGSQESFWSKFSLEVVILIVSGSIGLIFAYIKYRLGLK